MTTPVSILVLVFSNTPVYDLLDFFSNIVLFQPKHLKSKFEDAQQKYDGSNTVDKIKNWLSKAV